MSFAFVYVMYVGLDVSTSLYKEHKNVMLLYLKMKLLLHWSCMQCVWVNSKKLE